MQARGGLLVEGVRFRYPAAEFELSVPAFELKPGELVACIGTSGIGKSTLLGLLAGILRPGRGTIEFAGQDLSALGEEARRKLRLREIGLVFQEFELLDHLSVRENILLPYLISSALTLNEEVRERVLALATSAGIEALLDRHPRELSMGERQRVAICRALITRPSVVLADEPTGNLDPTTSLRVLELLLTEVRASGASLVMVTHDYSLLDSLDRVVDLAELTGIPA